MIKEIINMESYINSYGQFEDDKSIVLEIIGDNEKSSLYQELKKGIDSLDKGQKYSDEEVYKELDKI